MMLIRLPELLMQSLLWRFVGFTSSVVGLLCYALSSSFTHLFGKWNLLKILIYSVVSFIICSFMLFAKNWKLSRRLLVKAHLGFLVLMLTSLYSFFYDKAVNGKPDLLSLISCVAFAAMSLSLSRQTELGIEVDLLNFFLGCLTLQLMKINLMLAFIGAAFSYSLIVLRSSLDSQLEVADAGISDHVALDIDSTNQTDHNNQSHQSHSIHTRSPDDEYNWDSNPGQNQHNIKEEDNFLSSFSFQPHPTPRPPLPPTTWWFLSSATSNQTQQEWSFQEATTKRDGFSSGKSEVKDENVSMQSYSTEVASVQSDYSNYHPQSQTLSRRSDDGYNWRKYGQKQVKGSENPRSYYKCTYPNCPTKKKVERSLDGQITEIVYKGTHNHPKPQATRRNSSSASSLAIPASNPVSAEIPDQAFASVQTNHNSGFQSDHSNYHPQSQTLSRVPNDGYNWRKYGQKQVKGSENPRSYYKCTYPNCPTKKKVERSLDGQITEIVYKGTHNHPKPSVSRANSSSTSSHAIPPSNPPPLAPLSTSAGGPILDSDVTADNSSLSTGKYDLRRSFEKSKSGGHE